MEALQMLPNYNCQHLLPLVMVRAKVPNFYLTVNPKYIQLGVKSSKYNFLSSGNKYDYFVITQLLLCVPPFFSFLFPHSAAAYVFDLRILFLEAVPQRKYYYNQYCMCCVFFPPGKIPKSVKCNLLLINGFSWKMNMHTQFMHP